MLSRDRTRRVNVNRPSRFDGFVGIVALINLAFNVYETDGNEPQTYKQATKSKFWSQWHKAMLEEMHSLKINLTWILVPLPPSASVVDCMWLYELKK